MNTMWDYMAEGYKHTSLEGVNHKNFSRSSDSFGRSTSAKLWTVSEQCFDVNSRILRECDCSPLKSPGHLTLNVCRDGSCVRSISAVECHKLQRLFLLIRSGVYTSPNTSLGFAGGERSWIRHADHNSKIILSSSSWLAILNTMHLLYSILYTQPKF